MVFNFTTLASKDLTAKDINNAHVNEITMNKLKSMIGLRPQVIEDVTAMFEAFPHDNVVTQALFSFVSEFDVTNCLFRLIFDASGFQN